MKVNPVNNKIPFNKIVETFRRETTTVWDDGTNPEIVNTTYDTFEYTKEEDEDNKKESNE